MNNLKIPKSIRGIDGKAAYEQIMNETPKEPVQENPIVLPKEDTEGFIYVPSINLYVAKERSLLNKNFHETQEELHKNNQKMLNMPEFTEFLKYTKINYKEIYKEITEVRRPWRAEWIDADFKVKGEELFVNYHIFENGKIVKKEEKLDKDTLIEDKTPGISLEKWLENPNQQGFPKSDRKSVV